MSILNATEARSKLYALIDETSKTHKPITLTGKRGNVVLPSEEDWNAINETLYLVSIPGMRESPSAKEWKLTSKSAVKTWTGNVENLLYQASTERRRETRFVKSQAEGGGAFGNSLRKPFSKPSPL